MSPSTILSLQVWCKNFIINRTLDKCILKKFKTLKILDWDKLKMKLRTLTLY